LTGAVVRFRARSPRPEREVQLDPGESLMAAARIAGLPLGSSCDGRAVCGWCRVSVLSGSERLQLAGNDKRELLTRIGATQDERLACQARLRGAATVTITTTYW